MPTALNLCNATLVQSEPCSDVVFAISTLHHTKETGTSALRTTIPLRWAFIMHFSFAMQPAISNRNCRVSSGLTRYTCNLWSQPRWMKGACQSSLEKGRPVRFRLSIRSLISRGNNVPKGALGREGPVSALLRHAKDSDARSSFIDGAEERASEDALFAFGCHKAPSVAAGHSFTFLRLLPLYGNLSAHGASL